MHYAKLFICLYGSSCLWPMSYNNPKISRYIELQNNNKKIGNTLLIHGDSQAIADKVNTTVDVVLTDPVWPKALVDLPGSSNPFSLLKKVLEQLKRLLAPTGRIIIQLRCDTDPRLLSAVLQNYPFIRVAWVTLCLAKS